MRRRWVSALAVRCVGGCPVPQLCTFSGWVADHWLINIGSPAPVVSRHTDADSTHSLTKISFYALTSRFLGTARFLTHLLELQMEIKHVTGKECPRSKWFQKRSSSKCGSNSNGGRSTICVSASLSLMSPQEKGERAEIWILSHLKQ